ncbi:MAG TPA: hypothetical protein VGF18_02475, partial [Candidatus Tumulicola sp.]
MLQLTSPVEPPSSSDRYTVRIAESYSIAENTTYQALLSRLVEYTLRAAIARSVDQEEWEHEQLRRNGLFALQIFHNGKSAWDDPVTFGEEQAEARREHISSKFNALNELDSDLYIRLDRDLRERWVEFGYRPPSLLHDMVRLFAAIERDAAGRADD